ncbi:MAG: flippase-like domain-containing protein [Gemmatimonadaceae bacterium]
MKRWVLTAISFAAVIGVSIYAIRGSTPHGVRFTIPPLAHLLAFLAFAVEVATRSLKLTLSAKAVGTRLPFMTSLRTSLGGDFAASITPARVGAEPARFLILAQAGVAASDAMVVLYLELLLEAISMAVVVAVIALLFKVTGTALIAMIGVVGAYAGFVVTIGIVGVVLSRRDLGPEPPAWARRLRLHGKRWEFVQRWVDRVRVTVKAFKGMRLEWAAIALVSSITHISIRFTILPAIVYTMTQQPVPLAPLVMWPLGIIYGAGVVPAPGGGGAVELTFRAALGKVIPSALFAPALLWWRFYTFYIYIVVGGLVAGNTALRAVRDVAETEEELERA